MRVAAHLRVLGLAGQRAGHTRVRVGLGRRVAAGAKSCGCTTASQKRGSFASAAARAGLHQH